MSRTGLSPILLRHATPSNAVRAQVYVVLCQCKDSFATPRDALDNEVAHFRAGCHRLRELFECRLRSRLSPVPSYTVLFLRWVAARRALSERHTACPAICVASRRCPRALRGCGLHTAIAPRVRIARRATGLPTRRACARCMEERCRFANSRLSGRSTASWRLHGRRRTRFAHGVLPRCATMEQVRDTRRHEPKRDGPFAERGANVALRRGRRDAE